MCIFSIINRSMSNTNVDKGKVIIAKPSSSNEQNILPIKIRLTFDLLRPNTGKPAQSRSV